MKLRSFSYSALRVIKNVGWRGHLHLDVRRQIIAFHAAQAGESAVFVCGDSRVEAARLPCEILGIPVVNAGIGSATVRLVESEIKKFAGSAQCLVVCVGVNDAKTASKTSHSVMNFADAISQACSSLAPDNGRLVLATIPPVEAGKPLGVGYYDPELITHFNGVIRNLCKELKFVLADTAVELADSKGNLREGLSVDGVHLQPEAYVLWLRVIVQAIESSVHSAMST